MFTATYPASFLREKNAAAQKLTHVTEQWYRTHKIDARFGTVVAQLNIDRRIAVLGNGESIEFNKACLAMGSRPVRPPVAGVGLGNVIYLRSLRDAFALREMAEHEKSVVVVGGGLLACETAASLRQMKLRVSVMHRHANLLNRYVDQETGGWLSTYFGKNGVTLLLGESLNGEPNLDLVRNTPLSGPLGSPVTEYLETEEKGIYAVGDLAFYPDRLMGGMRRQTHWENAREQGLVAGANMTGKKRIRYEQIPYFWTEMFDLRLDFIGDFTLQPTRVELSGTYAKKKFSARYYQGERLRGILLSGAGQKEIEAAKSELREKLGK